MNCGVRAVNLGRRIKSFSCFVWRLAEGNPFEPIWPSSLGQFDSERDLLSICSGQKWSSCLCLLSMRKAVPSVVSFCSPPLALSFPLLIFSDPSSLNGYIPMNPLSACNGSFSLWILFGSDSISFRSVWEALQWCAMSQLFLIRGC